MTILLTGASGFLGRHVEDRLLLDGHHVVSVGRSQPHRVASNLTHVTTDLSDLAAGSLDWSAISAVVHLAAAGVKASNRAWPQALHTNIVGGARLLHLLRTHARRHPPVFLAGTYYERFVPNHAFFFNNPYCSTKAAFSRLAQTWAETYAGPVVFGSIFQVYGPGDDPDNVLAYAARCFKDREVARFGGGSGLRDWIYVSDVVAAIACTLGLKGAGVVRWDIGSGRLQSVKDMIHALADIARVGPDGMIFDPQRDRDDNIVPALAVEFPPGWKPTVDFRTGLRLLFDGA